MLKSIEKKSKSSDKNHIMPGTYTGVIVGCVETYGKLSGYKQPYKIFQLQVNVDGSPIVQTLPLYMRKHLYSYDSFLCRGFGINDSDFEAKLRELSDLKGIPDDGKFHDICLLGETFTLDIQSDRSGWTKVMNLMPTDDKLSVKPYVIPQIKSKPSINDWLLPNGDIEILGNYKKQHPPVSHINLQTVDITSEEVQQTAVDQVDIVSENTLPVSKINFTNILGQLTSGPPVIHQDIVEEVQQETTFDSYEVDGVVMRKDIFEFIKKHRGDAYLQNVYLQRNQHGGLNVIPLKILNTFTNEELYDILLFILEHPILGKPSRLGNSIVVQFARKEQVKLSVSECLYNNTSNTSNISDRIR